MHDYLRAIGFSAISGKRELNKIIHSVIDEPDSEFITDNGIESALGEKSKEFSERIGITVRGEYDENGEFSYEYYFPYFEGSAVTTREAVSIEKYADKNSFAGVCDDINVGVSLVFHLLNMVDYVDHKQFVKKDNSVKPIILSGLSISGKILLPILKSESAMKQKSRENTTRNNMIAAARQGDQDAIESLTLEDLDLFTAVSRRAQKEDILTIVESYFMPYGIACDQYSILGTIIDLKETKNHYTGEQLYVMQLECNDLLFDICMNKKDLYGEPMIGRRFKGNVWMQGKVEFEWI